MPQLCLNTSPSPPLGAQSLAQSWGLSCVDKCRTVVRTAWVGAAEPWGPFPLGKNWLWATNEALPLPVAGECKGINDRGCCDGTLSAMPPGAGFGTRGRGCSRVQPVRPELTVVA